MEINPPLWGGKKKKKKKIWAIAVICLKLPKVNNDPIGENSPNLVTLLGNPLIFTPLKTLSS
jgi:hypothetical protein